MGRDVLCGTERLAIGNLADAGAESDDVSVEGTL